MVLLVVLYGEVVKILGRVDEMFEDCCCYQQEYYFVGCVQLGYCV